MQINNLANTGRKTITIRQIIFAVTLGCLLCIGALSDNGFCRDIPLAWNSNPDPDIAGYRVYYGLSSRRYTDSIDVGFETTFTLSGLDGKKTYYFAVTAYNTEGLESDYSAEINSSDLLPTETVTNTTNTTNDAASASTSGGGGGGGCFIATAAYGSYLAPEVWVLRHFRDEYLLTCKPGQWFVSLYYRFSPPIAAVIAQSETLRFLTRMALTPLIYSFKYIGVKPLLLLLLFAAGLTGRSGTRPRHRWGN